MARAEQLPIRHLRAVPGQRIGPRAHLHRQSLFRRSKRGSLRLSESSADAGASPARLSVRLFLALKMRSRRLTLVAIGALLAFTPARAQTYDPSYPVCMQIYGPV